MPWRGLTQGVVWIGRWLGFFVVAGLVQGWIMRPDLIGSERAATTAQATSAQTLAALHELTGTIEAIHHRLGESQARLYRLEATQALQLRLAEALTARIDRHSLLTSAEDTWRAWVYAQIQAMAPHDAP